MSKKLTGIRLVSVELEIGRETAAEGAKAFQQLVAAWLARHTELSFGSHVDLDFIAFPEPKRFNHDGGKANRETISPFGDLHAISLSAGYTSYNMYIQ
ncbi:hypothetical protein V1273_003045 [Bradyrhizobium sp. AZCC 1721]